MKSTILIVALATLCAHAGATPVTFSVDPAHSMPRFSYSHFGFSTQLGRFDKMSGTVTLDSDAKTGSMELQIDMDSLDGGMPILNKHLKSADLLDVAKYPTAVFKSTQIVFDGDRPSAINGNLTMHGVTLPVTFTVTSFKHGPHGFVQNREAVGGNAVATVSRSAFGVGRFAPNVSDEVTISIGLEAIRD
ncbi:MAG: polyisoprenoid-binding protein [Paucibacter sp.]|nr:polyisoprenoid-binding protein [Roseateles sp.]